MKTLEELAEEYTFQFSWNNPREEDVQEAYVAGYKAAVPQWISVKDRLPEEGQDCVIYVDWVDVWNKGSERITYQEIAVFNGDDRFYHRAHTELNRVTHWMPLPKSPEEV
jgi:hypothetical protein